MPYRTYNREQDWLLPPSLGELIAEDHPVRFVAYFVDELELGEISEGSAEAVEGAPAYDPRMLLAVWLYGFMTRVRSTRKLERACRENVVFMWLTGMQRPDHSTLSRFYQRHRPMVRQLLRKTVRLAMEVGLVEFALQAIDGTRMASASRRSWRTRAEVSQLLQQVEEEIAAMEAANQEEERGEGSEPKGPRGRLGREDLRGRLRQAIGALDEREGERRSRKDAGAVSTSDPEAGMIKVPGGHVVGYNAQAVVDSQAQIVVAADVTSCSSDGEQLLPMLAEARAMTGQDAEVVTADSGYHAMPAILEVQQSGPDVYVSPRRKRKRGQEPDPYEKAQFQYDAETDSYLCPKGQRLTFDHRERTAYGKLMEVRVYRCRHCQGCAARESGACTKAKEGRRIKRYPTDDEVPAYLEKLKSERGKEIRRQRSATVEPLFADTKERLAARRFLLRGLENAQAEWRLTCVVHNLLKLWRYWWQPKVLPARCLS